MKKHKLFIRFHLTLSFVFALASCTPDDSFSSLTSADFYDVRGIYTFNIGTLVNYYYKGNRHTNPDGAILLSKNGSIYNDGANLQLNILGKYVVKERHYETGEIREVQTPIMKNIFTDANGDFSLQIKHTTGYGYRIIELSSLNVKITTKHLGHEYSKAFNYDGQTLWSKALGFVSELLDGNYPEVVTWTDGSACESHMLKYSDVCYERIIDLSRDIILEKQ